VTGDASFRVFLRGSIIGSAETSLTRSDDGWLIKGTGRLAPPLDLTIRRLEVRYSADWKPRAITLELRTPEGNVVTNGTFQPDAPARIDVVRSGQETLSTTPQVAADAVIVPNIVYSAYEYLAVRLMSASPGIQFPAFVVRTDRLSQQQSAPVAELRHVDAELMTGIDRSQRVAAGNPAVARKRVDEFPLATFIEPDQ
jgi:hypothetical protein